MTETTEKEPGEQMLFNVEGIVHRVIEGHVECFAADGWRRCDGELVAILNSGTAIDEARALEIDEELTEEDLVAELATKTLDGDDVTAEQGDGD